MRMGNVRSKVMWASLLGLLSVFGNLTAVSQYDNHDQGYLSRYEGEYVARTLALPPDGRPESFPPSGITSDDFSSAALNTGLWTFVNPGAPSTLSLIGTGTNDALLSIQVPAGTPHDVWTGGNGAPRIMQNTANTDFEVEVKFQSILASAFQIQGIIVQQDLNNFIRFDVYRNLTETRIFAATFVAGTPTIRHNVAITGATPLFLRVRRTGNQWQQWYSYNGTTWIPAALFNHTLAATAIGPFAGNAGSPAPAFTALVDYFFNTAAPIVPEDPLAPNPWWSQTRRYRVPYEVRSNGFERINKPVEIPINFTTHLSSLGQNGTFAPTSIRVIEVSNAGVPTDTSVSFQFDPDSTYNPLTNAGGTLTCLLPGSTGATGVRYLHIYFDKEDFGPFTLPPITQSVVLTDGVDYRGQTSFKIETPIGTYYYHKLGGGFASFIDTQGNDWLGYAPGGGSAGDFRGLPNLGDVFHPGYTNSTSSVISSGPLKSRIRSTSTDGGWECVWDIFPGYARMTLLRKSADYWFMYEGTPGGSLEASTDFVVRSTGARTPLTTSWTEDLPGNEWAYFGDGGMQRVLYLIHHEDDTQPDYFRQMENNMTVFGFGRQDPCCTRYLTAVPQTFTMGFSEDSSFAGASRVINSSYQELYLVPGIPVTNLDPISLPSIVTHPANQSILVGQTATFVVAAAGSLPLQYQWQRNGVAIPGATSFAYTTPAAIAADNSTQFRCVVTNPSGSATSNPALLNVQAVTTPIISDDFNALSLNTGLWTYTNPGTPSTLSLVGAGTEDALLSIQIPAGSAHDVWTDGVGVPRIMQPSPNSDFEIEVKFQSAFNARFQIQGVLIQQDNGNLLRFDFYRDAVGPRVFAASFVNGVPTTRHNVAVAPGNPLYMRVRRLGNEWTQTYSFNGTTWLNGASFTHNIVVTSVGPFFGNAGSPAPAFTGLLDYFFNIASPKIPEDGALPPDTTSPVITSVVATPSATSAQITWTTDELATGIVQYGLTTGYELGSASHPGRLISHQVQVPNLLPSTTYQFRVISADSSGNTRTSGNFSFTTQASPNPVISIWYGKQQTFGQIGNPVPDINILGNVTDPDGIKTLRYTLNGGSLRTLTVGPDTRRLARKGDFNIDIPYSSLLTGANQIVITATDSLNNVSRDTVTANYVAGNSWPQTYGVDWSTTSSIGNVAQVVDGKWTIQSNGLRTVQTGYDRAVAIGERTWTNYEITVPITIFSVDSVAAFQFPSNGAGIGFLMRWPGHSDLPGPLAGRQPKTGFLPLGALSWYAYQPGGVQQFRMLGNNVQTIAVDSTGKRLSLNIEYNFKMRVQTLPGTGSVYRMKVWQVGTSEPPTWDLTGMQGLSDPQMGSVLLMAHQVDVRIGNVSIVPVTDLTPALSITTIGSGEVSRLPNQPTYYLGQLVTLTALPASGAAFDQWSGDLSGGSNPAALIMDNSKNVTATFSGTGLPPVITNVKIYPTSGHVTFMWSTDRPSSGMVSLGTSPSYGMGSFNSASVGTQHSITVPGLNPGSMYHFQLSSAVGSAVTNTSDSTFTTSGPSTIVSDDFSNPTLNPTQWTFINPLGDGTMTLSGAGTEDARITLTVPGGVAHDVWSGGIMAPRIVQAMNNADFEVEAKFESPLSSRFQMMGLIFSESPTRFIRMDFHSDGAQTRAFGATINGTTASTHINGMVGGGPLVPLYMRVRRDGDLWTQSYSFNGSVWIPAGSFRFPLLANSVALFAGNAGSPVPAVVAIADYFFNTASPIIPEDGGPRVPPTIVQHPSEQTVALGQPVTFNARANGTAPLQFQWERGGVDIPGATDTSYMIASAAADDNGAEFRCRVSNAYGLAYTNAAQLLVLSPPEITSQPGDERVAVGQTARFQIGVSGSFPFTFQWQRNGVDIPNANLLVYTTSPVTPSDSGARFRCRATNAVGEVMSLEGILHVDSPPAITSQPTDKFVNVGTTATFSVVATGTQPLSYQWQRNSVDIFGANGSSYTTPVVAQSDSGARYRVKVWNWIRLITSDSAILHVDSPVLITTQPQNQSVQAGQTASFSVVVSGTPPFSYQWQKNNVDIPGANAAAYTTPPTSTSDNGATFRCRITNQVRTVTSNPAILTITGPSRVTANLQALYTFEEGAGTAVNDVSGVGAPLNMTIASASAVTWIPGALRVNSSTTILTPAAGSKVITAVTAANQITVEAWIKPTNTSQSGPAHIVAITPGSGDRNFLMGQAGNKFEMRLRTSTTDNKGVALTSAKNSVTTALTHMVYTRNSSGVAKLYLNGVEVVSGTASGTLANWNTTYKLGLANEPGRSRPWLGELHLVAFYSRALTAAEVGQNFSVGANPGGSAVAAANPQGEERPFSGEIPTEFGLRQNYPNPFNPVTRIRYELPQHSPVVIKVYSLLGQEIATLLETAQPAGVHEVSFDATGLSSGVYLYRMQAGDFTMSRRFVLLK